MHILFLTDNFPPEMNAPASRTFEHAKRWVAAGARVTVVTCFPNFPAGKIFPGYRNRFYQREVMDGIEVVRVWSYVTANEGFIKRTLDYLSFLPPAVIASLFISRPNVVVATSPQFFCAVAGFFVSRLKRRPFVFELRDLWPDSIVAVGAMKESFPLKMLRRLEYYLYRKATRIVSLTHSFKTVLTNNGIPADKIVVVPNGADLDAYQPGERPDALATKIGIENKFVAAYVGTIGMAHGLETLLKTAAQLRHRSDIAFVLVGPGAQKDELEQLAKEQKLDNIFFVGPVTKTEVKAYWRLADVALVLLKDVPLFQHVIPSKMFEAMSTEKPIILGVRGESQGILEKSRAGIVIPPEDDVALSEAILKLADDREMRETMGKAGRQFVTTHFDRDQLAKEMLFHMANACGISPQTGEINFRSVRLSGNRE